MNNYLLVNVTGKNIYNFIEKCKNNNINLFSITFINNRSINIKIDYKDYNKLLKIKSYYKVKSINKYGAIKIKERILRYKFLTISIIIGFIILLILSNTIFDINIVSSNNRLNKKIKKELEYYDLKKYSLVKNYDEIENIKTKILKKYRNNIEWIEIKRNGVSYDIQIVERKISKKKSNNKVSNIIAKKIGIIKEINVIDGERILNENDYVTKGDVIISGILKKDDEIKGLVRANGNVYGETWYRVKVEYPLNYKEYKYTNKKKKNLYLKIGNKIIEKKKFNKYDRERIIGYNNNIVPFEIGIEYNREIIVINDKLSLKEAKDKAKNKAYQILKKRLNDDEYIISEKTLNFYQKNSKIVLEEFFSCYENIGVEEKLE